MKAFILLALLALLAVAGLLAPHRASGPSTGARGEARVDRRLRAAFDPSTHHVLRNLTLMAADGTTQIDHVVVSPTGIFVIETKTMAGWIFGDGRAAAWTQVLGRRRFRFQNPLRQNHRHVKVIEELLGLDRRLLHNVVVFAGDAEPKTPMPDDVLWSVADPVAHLRLPRAPRLTASEAEAIAGRLRKIALEPGRRTDRDHIRSLSDRAARASADLASCPRCGSAMVARRGRRSDEAFLGCRRFPACRGSRARLEEADAAPLRA